MRFLLLFITSTFLLFSCKKEEVNSPEVEDTTTYNAAQVYNLKDVSYGSHASQKMDIYLPANRSSNTKVFVMIHGGGWSAGDKQDFRESYLWLKSTFPNHAIININYRLATLSQPGYDMQMQDVQSAITEIRKDKYGVGNELAMVGSSAGGHLAMMYAYRYDTNQKVKTVINMVGPTDFSDPNYAEDPAFSYALIYLIGPYTYAEHPQRWKDVSPVNYISTLSPPTISFFGDADDLVPSSQMGRLDAKLVEFNVPHHSTMYAGEGHGGWSATTTNDFVTKVYQFIQTHFSE